MFIAWYLINVIINRTCGVIFKTFFTYFCKLKHKAIKKSYKILFYTLLALIVSPILLYLVVLIPAVQNKTASIITQRLSEDIGTDITIGSVRFYPIKKIVIQNLLLKDQKQDSLLYAKSISASIDSVVFSDKKIYLGIVGINNLKTELKTYKNASNFSFLVDSLLKDGNKNSKWTYAVSEIKLKNSFVSYKNQKKAKRKVGFDPNNLSFEDLNLSIGNISKSKEKNRF